MQELLLSVGMESACFASTKDLLEASVPGRADPVTLVNAGFVASADGPGLQHGIPSLGEHTDAYLTQLGLGGAEIARLRAEKIVA